MPAIIPEASTATTAVFHSILLWWWSIYKNDTKEITNNINEEIINEKPILKITDDTKKNTTIDMKSYTTLVILFIEYTFSNEVRIYKNRKKKRKREMIIIIWLKYIEDEKRRNTTIEV